MTLHRFARSLVVFSAAAWGLGVAVSLAPLWQQPAPANQLPGYMKSVGLDAIGPFLLVASLAIFPFIAALIGRLFASRLEEGETKPWAANVTAGAFLLGLWGSLIQPPPFWSR